MSQGVLQWTQSDVTCVPFPEKAQVRRKDGTPACCVPAASFGAIVPWVQLVCENWDRGCFSGPVLGHQGVSGKGPVPSPGTPSDSQTLIVGRPSPVSLAEPMPRGAPGVAGAVVCGFPGYLGVAALSSGPQSCTEEVGTPRFRGQTHWEFILTPAGWWWGSLCPEGWPAVPHPARLEPGWWEAPAWGLVTPSTARGSAVL